MSSSIRAILVTGGAGFIGSCLVRHIAVRRFRVINLDKLTYAGNLESLAAVATIRSTYLSRGISPIFSLVSSLLDNIARRPSSTWRPNRTSTARSMLRRRSSRRM